MDWFVQTMMFFQEWWPAMVLLLFVVAGMATDLSLKIRGYMRDFNSVYPNAFQFIERRREYVIKCYDRLLARIIAGFSLIGGKEAWKHLINACYSFIRKRQHRE